MIKSFFVAAIRNLRKNKIYAFINVSGLALAVACCMIIFVIVRYETSFDDYHSKAERIYRINLNQRTQEGLRLDGCNYSPLANAVRSEVTGLEAVTGVYCLQLYQVNKGNEIFEDKYAFFADQQYFDVFDVKWMAGRQDQALTVANSVVVTDAFAEKYLNGIDQALGATFLLENKVVLTVTGIVQAPPTNTDHPYSILISYPTLAEYIPETVDNWETVGQGSTYVVFHENTTQEQVYGQFKTIINKYLDSETAKNTKFFLMALNDNHDRNFDYTSYTYDFPVPVMIMLSIMAGMISVIACINFVNLATAQSLTRAREVGIRKTLGSSRLNLIVQYMSEGFVITLMAVGAGLLLAQLGMRLLNEQYGGTYLQFNFLSEPSILMFIFGIIILITILAGFYPAFVLSGYRPVMAMKSQLGNTTSKGLTLRRGLVLSQFIGAQMLILVTLIMVRQISHFKERPLDYKPDTMVMLPHLRGNENQQHMRFEKELKEIPGVISQTFSFGLPGGGQPLEFHGKKGADHSQTALVNYVDTEYLRTFNIQLLAGNNFSGAIAQASAEVMVNEAMVKALELESPHSAVGHIYTLNGQEVRIRGVFKDYFTRSMSSTIDPVALRYDPAMFSGVALSIATDNIPETIAAIEAAWKTVYPDYLCRYRFLDDVLERRYGFFSFIFTFFGSAAFLAIAIGCLGLYGLVSFMAVRRTKEIGVRKVLGATVSNIMVMFTREYVALILIAFLVAAPLSHYLGKAMLMELPERTNPGAGVFLLTLAGSLFLASLTVSYRSFAAAVQSPADTLRTE